jgi:predicted NBD/HSP70 family sugar kinase
MNITDAEIRVLRAIFFLDTPTRRGIAEHAGMSVVSVTAVLGRLMEQGHVIISGKSGSGGRPSAIYRIVGGFSCTIGIFIGAKRIQIYGVDASRDIIDQHEAALAISARSGAHSRELIDQVCSEVRGFMVRERMRGQRVLAAGVAVPGMVDTERGIWLRGLQFSGVENVPIGAVLERSLDLPVIIEDPARCIAFLVMSKMGRSKAGDLVFLNLDRGVGASIVMNGELYRGNHGLAGEVGHLVVDKGGARCSCGNVGCLETVLSERAIIRRFQQRLSEGVISTLQRADASDLSLESILAAARADDRLAQSTLFELGGFLGNACTTLIHMYNPRTLVIGGRAGILGEYFRESAWQTIRQQVIPEMLVDLNIEYDITRPGDEAVGSALIAQRWAWQHIDELLRHKQGGKQR